jgi:hypothetical protein
VIPTGGCALANLLSPGHPIGSATPFQHLFLLQVPPPWERIALSSPHAPYGVREALAALARSGLTAHAMLIDGGEPAPPDGVRVLHFARPPGLTAGYAFAEHVLPAASVASSIEALARDWSLQAAVPDPIGDARYLFVCTHGERDGCCGRFGEAAYRYLRERHAGPGLRVWRVSHFGGHRFAPTLLDFPTGRCWGHLSEDACDALVRHSVHPRQLAAHYRGWCALSSEAQIAESDLFFRHGWDWLNVRAHADTRSRKASRSVEFHYQRSGEPRSLLKARLVPIGELTAPASCGDQPSRFVRYSCRWEHETALAAPPA